MAKLKEQISIKNQSFEFQKILDNPNNPRIIFSGIFGSGKTTFLKEYFKEKQDKYFDIHLFPINYVSNQNEDIFELIKFDVLYELLNKHNPNLEDLDLSYLDAIPFAVSKIGIDTLTQFIELIPKIGKPIADIIKPLFELDKLIRATRTEIKDATNEGKQIEKFALDIFNKKGNAYEFDLYTKLIQQLIKRKKEEIKQGSEQEKEFNDDGDEIINPGMQSVLIVDDLDRIDPDNIFRLLNVFSAHFDLRGDTNDNKFGFDKIIFCCDIENIRKIFQHRFGLDVDFNGYIDKFYTDVFEYDNSAEVKKIIENVMRSVTLSNGRLWKKGKGRLDDPVFENTVAVIEFMIESKAFNLRKLINLNNATIIERKYYVNIQSHQFDKKVNIRLFNLFDFLIKLLGSCEAVLKALQKTIFPITMKSYIKENLIAESLIIIDGRFDSKIRKLDIPYNKSNGIIYHIHQYETHLGTTFSAKIQGFESIDPPLNVNDFIVDAFTAYSRIRGGQS